jgi:hypothetical protein
MVLGFRQDKMSSSQSGKLVFRVLDAEDLRSEQGFLERDGVYMY